MVRLDGLQRGNAGIGSGEHVTLRRAESRPATRVVFAPAQREMRLQGPTQALKRNFFRKPLVAGDLVATAGQQPVTDMPPQVSRMFNAPAYALTQIRLQVVSTAPKGIVHIDENTEVELRAEFEEPRDGRGRCLQLGFCFQGCKSGAKWSTLYTELPAADATGNFELRTEAHVTRIEHNAAGRVNGVVYMDKDGKEQRQKARIVCVAGNAIETPRLLLLSASNMFKDGLANSSGQVGRNYMRHMTGSVYAAFKNPVHMYRGTTMAGIVRDEARHDTRRGFAGGYELETVSLGIPFMAAFLNPGGWGADFAWWMDHYANLAGMWLVGEDMPRETNRVTLNTSVKDQYGNYVPNVHFDDHDNDIAMRNHAFTQAERIYGAAGAIKTFRTPPYPSTHNMGTARMSARAQDGVCNQWGQTHDIPNLFISDGSQFTTGGAENPTLTIVSLAIRQADYIASQMAQRAL